MIRLNIPLANACGQCYSGAKNMCGTKNGIPNKILIRKSKIIFHTLFWACFKFGCWRHSEECRVFDNSIDTAYEISNLIKKSPKRDAMLHKTRKDILLEYPGFRALCPTR